MLALDSVPEEIPLLFLLREEEAGGGGWYAISFLPIDNGGDTYRSDDEA